MSQSTDNAFLQDYTATFFPRLGAFLIDLAVVGVAISMLVSPLALLTMMFPDFFLFQNVFFCYSLADIAGYVVYKAYFLLLTGITGTTLGKRLFHLSVVDREGGKLRFGQLLFRETVGRFLSSVLFWGYIMSFIDKEHRAFHDFVADTSVICSQKMKLVKVKPKQGKNAAVAGIGNNVSGNMQVSQNVNGAVPTVMAENSEEAKQTFQAENTEEIKQNVPTESEDEKKGLVKHVILWKLKDTLSPEEKENVKQEIKKGLEGLKDQIPGLIDIRVNTEGLETSNADLMLDSLFTGREALSGYAIHPLHVAVADGVVRPNTAERVCLDYEV